MRIGIDCRTVLDPERGEFAGVGHYTDALVRAMVKRGKEHTFVLFFDKHAKPSIRHELGAFPNVEIRVFPFHVFISRIPILQSHVIVAALFARAKLDLLHGPANVVPIFYRGPFVVTVHDLAIYEHPEWFPSPFPGTPSFSTRLVVPSSVERARRVIAVSQSTANDILLNFEVDEGVIDVIPEGVVQEPDLLGMEYTGHDDVLGKFGINPENYFFSVGTIEPRKNLIRSVLAFSSFFRSSYPRHGAMRYVIAGRAGWKYDDIIETIHAENSRIERETGKSDAIILAGYVSSQEKKALLSHASALVFPSLYEGFGLPVLEGMSAGTPVITSDISSMPEVAGDAAIFVDPLSIEAITSAMLRIVDDRQLTETYREKGRCRAAQFKWSDVAEKTLETYAKALKGKA